MELTVRVKEDGIPTVRMAADTAARMSAYQAQVLLRRGNITANAKSLMGIVSLKLRDGMACTIIANGPDEAEAVCEMARLLQD